MKIQVLGTGCAKCARLMEHVETAAQTAGVFYELEKVTDIRTIMGFGVMSTPACVIDGVVKVAGKVPPPEEIRKWLVPV